MRIALTDRFCDRHKTGGEYFDQTVSGLALTVGKRTKPWSLHYTDGKRKRLALASYPSLSLSAARRKALEAKALIKEGIAEIRRSEIVPLLDGIEAPAWC